MITKKDIEFIYFDSGMVLQFPVSNEWFYTAQYKEYCKKEGIREKSLKQMLNFSKAYQYLISENLIPDENKEFEVFMNFYSILFKGIKYKDNENLINLCANSKVKNYSRYAFYNDVKSQIEKYSKKYKLGIISDGWPSLENVYRSQGMKEYFDPFIISTIHGFSKNYDELFEIALKECGHGVKKCLFIDDNIGNCVRAKKLGFNVLRMNRNNSKRNKNNIDEICSLEELKAYL